MSKKQVPVGRILNAIGYGSGTVNNNHFIKPNYLKLPYKRRRKKSDLKLLLLLVTKKINKHDIEIIREMQFCVQAYFRMSEYLLFL